MKRLLVTAFIFLLAAAPAHASRGRWQLTPSGDPLLAMSPDLDATFEGADAWWFACGPGAPCGYAGFGHSKEPGETPAGTVYEFEFAVPGYLFERSPVWQGRVAAVSPPALTGSAVPGGTVKVTPARWRGGWGDELSASILLACRTACHPVPDGKVLAKDLGATLYAVEYRVAKDAPAFAPPATVPASSALVSVSAPVTVAADAKDVTVDLYTRAVRGSVGQVWCEEDCRVALAVGSRKRTFKVHKHATLKVLGVRPGRHKVAVKVDGVEITKGTVRL
jgi:hypothetical protein